MKVHVGTNASVEFLIGRMLIFGAALAFGCAGSRLHAQQIESIQVGFGGVYKVGFWTPIRIQFTNVPTPSTGRIELSIPDGSGHRSTVVYRHQNLVEGNNYRTVYAKFGQLEGSLRVQFVAADGAVIEREFAAGEFPGPQPSATRLILSLGTDIGIGPAVKRWRRRSDEYVVHAQLTELEQLPMDSIGFDGADLLVITTMDPNTLAGMATTQMQAIRQYVQQGGQVIISAAQNAESVAKSELASFLPGEFDQIVMQRQTAGIEEFAENVSERIDSDVAFRLPVAKLNSPHGKILLEGDFASERNPNIILSSLEFGRILFVAFDLEGSAFTNWKDTPVLIGKLLEVVFGESQTEATKGSTISMTRSGYDDLVGQLRAALEEFPTAGFTPFSLIALLIGIYLVVIGPVDYLLLKRNKRRFLWTWLSFPLVVVLYCGMVFAWSKFNTGAEVAHNRFTIVDLDHQHQIARGTAWMHVYSPNPANLDLELEPKLAGMTQIDRSELSWQGLPGTGFGGMDAPSTTASAGDYRLDVELDSHFKTSLQGFPIAGNSSCSLIGRWHCALRPNAFSDATQLSVRGENELEGTISNPLSMDLEDCLLVYDRWAYQLGKLEAGQVKLLADVRARDLQTLLTRQEFVEGRYKMAPWKRESSDVAQIGNMLMYYSAINGQGYTKLYHRYQTHVDCGPLIKDRAILIGRSHQASTELLHTGQPIECARNSSTTYYRIHHRVAEKD